MQAMTRLWHARLRRRGRPAVAAALILTGLALFVPTTLPAQNIKKKQATEAEALELLSPLALGHELGGGFKLSKVRVHPEFIRYDFHGHVDGAGACSVVFELTAFNADHAGLVPLERYSLFLFESTCAQSPDALICAVSERIEKNEASGPFLFPHGTTPENPKPSFSITPYLCLLYLLAGLVLLALSLRSRKRRLEVFPLPEAEAGAAFWVLPLAAVAAAAALRALDSPMTIANANSHAYFYVKLAMQGIESGHALNGNGYPSFFHLLYVLGFPYNAETIMAANIVLGSLSVLVLYALALVLLADRRAAIFAACMWAVLPAHVRLSSSADFPALLSLSQILAGLAVASAARRFQTLSLAAAACLILFSVQVRPEGWIMVPAAAFLFLSVSGWSSFKRILRRIDFWVVAALFAAGAAGPMLNTLEYMGMESGPAASINVLSLRTFSSLLLRPLGSPEGIGNLSLNPLFTSPLVPLLAGVGLWKWAGPGRWISLALLASYLVFALPVIGFQLSVIPTMRLQVSYQWILLVPAGFGFAWLAKTLHGKKIRPLIFWLLVLSALSYLPYRGFVGHLYPPQREYGFLKKAMEKIPDGCTLVHLDKSVGPLYTDLPTWIPYGAGKSVHFEQASDFLSRSEIRPDQCFLFYRGLTCFAFPANAAGPTEQPLCRALLELAAEPVAGMTMKAEKYDQFHMRADVATLEMRRLLPGKSIPAP